LTKRPRSTGCRSPILDVEGKIHGPEMKVRKNLVVGGGCARAKLRAGLAGGRDVRGFDGVGFRSSFFETKTSGPVQPGRRLAGRACSMPEAIGKAVHRGAWGGRIVFRGPVPPGPEGGNGKGFFAMKPNPSTGRGLFSLGAARRATGPAHSSSHRAGAGLAGPVLDSTARGFFLHGESFFFPHCFQLRVGRFQAQLHGGMSSGPRSFFWRNLIDRLRDCVKRTLCCLFGDGSFPQAP